MNVEPNEPSNAKLVTWVAVGCFAGVFLACFWEVLFLPRRLGYRDVEYFFEPLFRYLQMEWGAGRVPLWNPYSHGGIPLVGQGTPSVFYPGKLVFALPVPFQVAFKFYVLVHVVVAGLGAWWTARAWSCSHAAAALASLSYAFGGSVLFMYTTVVFLVSAAWLPFAVLCVDDLLRTRHPRSAVGLAVSMSLMVLGGDPQTAFYVGVVAGLGLLTSFRRTSETTASNVKPLLWSAGLLAVSAGLAAALAAVQLLPSLELNATSSRSVTQVPSNVWQVPGHLTSDRHLEPRPDTGELPKWYDELVGDPPPPAKHHVVTYNFSLTPRRYAEWFLPNPFGRSLSGQSRWTVWKGERLWMPTLYAGLVPFVLALCSLRLWGGSQRARWLSWTVVVFAVGSLGRFGIGWLITQTTGWDGVSREIGGLYWLMNVLLPVHSSFRYPQKMWMLAALAASLLAAFGWDALREHRTWPRRLLLGYAVVTGIAFLAIAVQGIALLNGSVAELAKQLPMLEALLACFGHACVVGVVAWFLLGWHDKRPLAAGLAVVAVTAVDLAVANAWCVRSLDYLDGSPELLQYVEAAQRDRQDGTPVRVRRPLNWKPVSTRLQKDSTDGNADVWARSAFDTLGYNHHLPLRVAKIGGSSTIKINLVESYFDPLPMGESKLALQPRRAFDAWGCDLFVMPDLPPRKRLPRGARMDYTTFGLRRRWSEPRWSAENPESTVWPNGDPLPNPTAESGGVFGDYPGSVLVLRNTDALPRAWVVREIEVRPPIDEGNRLDWVPIQTSIVFPLDEYRDVRQTAIVEDVELPPGTASRTETLGSGEADLEACRVVHHDPSRVEFEAELETDGFLVVAETYDADWTVEISTDGGEPVPGVVHRTNVAMRGVRLPAGTHRLVFRYQPRSIYVGGTVSATAWLAVLVLSVLFLRGRRREPAE